MDDTAKPVIYRIDSRRVAYKIKNVFKSLDDPNEPLDICLVPLEKHYALMVYGGNADVIQNRIHMACERLSIPRIPSALFQNDGGSSYFPENDTTMLNLPDDCLHLIFKACSLKTQILLSKVCQGFFYVIRDLWIGKYRTFDCNTTYFEFTERLTENEINDFCIVVGPFVETLRFNSIFYFELMQKHLADVPGNLNENARRFINARLCKILQYFENLKIFEVQGKFLMDFTVEQLSRYCEKSLHTIHLLDWDSRFVTGRYMHRFSNLEHLHLRACSSLTKESLLRICSHLRLKSLDIVECEQLDQPEFIEKCCNHLEDLEVFKIHWNAIQREETLSMIFQILTKLKVFELHWITEAFVNVNISGLLFNQVSMYRSANIKGLKFINDRLPIENQSFSFQNQDPYKYAMIRENSAARGRAWCLDEYFDSYLAIFRNLTSLGELEFKYCRIFNNDNLLKLSSVCKNLKQLKLVGHPMKTDKKLLENWTNIQGCDLLLKSFVDFNSVEAIRSTMERQRVSGGVMRFSPTIRCIKCEFLEQ